MSSTKEPTYVVSVRVSLQDLATIGKFLQETGLYAPARPSGALAAAMKLLADSLRANGIYSPESIEEALITLGTLRYPLEQLESQLSTQQRVQDKESLREETLSMLGTSAKTLGELRKAVQSSPLAKEKVEALIAEHSVTPAEFTEADRVRLEREKESNLRQLREAGILGEE